MKSYVRNRKKACKLLSHSRTRQYVGQRKLFAVRLYFRPRTHSKLLKRRFILSVTRKHELLHRSQILKVVNTGIIQISEKLPEKKLSTDT